MTWLQLLGNDLVVSVMQFFAIFTGFILSCIANWLTYKALKRDEISRRASNNFQLTAHHREIWSLVFTVPALHRVKSATVDISKAPVTDDELLFVHFLILHLASAYQMITKQVLDRPERLGADIHAYFALPIPRFVWDKAKKMQDAEFVAHVEAHIESENAE